MIAKKIIFKGSVQGVGFRFTAHSIARRLNLTGYVRNCYDGSVELLAQGNPEDIESCIKYLHDSFPGCIKNTETTDLPTNPEFKDFKITF